MEERRIPLHTKANNLWATDQVIKDEYDTLLKVDRQKIKEDADFLESSPGLDRYNLLYPFKYNKITINTEKGYINASPINIGQKQNLFIATQGPKENTIEDFWTMVWEFNCKVIVMLTNLIEADKIKCENYWEAKMDKFEVNAKEVEKKDMYLVREIKLKNLSKKEEKERTVNQIHFTKWPDQGAILDNNLLIFCEINKLIDDLNKTEPNQPNQPIIVHCSAGQGRTGTFIAMYLIEKEIEKQIKDDCQIIRFNIFNLVRKLKEMRAAMVNTYEQYFSIYYFAYFLLDKINN